MASSRFQASKLYDFACTIYDGGFRKGDLEEIMFQFGKGAQMYDNPEEGLSLEDAEEVCEILAYLEEREVDE